MILEIREANRRDPHLNSFSLRGCFGGKGLTNVKLFFRSMTEQRPDWAYRS